MLIHICDYASQPDIRIFCTQKWTTPSWGKDGGMTSIKDVYLADDESYYTFNPSLANCPACKRKEVRNKEVLK